MLFRSVVAVFLGWAFDSEPLTARTLVAAAVIIAGVVVITTVHSRVPAQAGQINRESLTVAPARMMTETVSPRISATD